VKKFALVRLLYYNFRNVISTSINFPHCHGGLPNPSKAPLENWLPEDGKTELPQGTVWSNGHLGN